MAAPLVHASPTAWGSATEFRIALGAAMIAPAILCLVGDRIRRAQGAAAPPERIDP